MLKAIETRVNRCQKSATVKCEIEREVCETYGWEREREREREQERKKNVISSSVEAQTRDRPRVRRHSQVQYRRVVVGETFAD
jgi:hypothetical protein